MVYFMRCGVYGDTPKLQKIILSLISQKCISPYTARMKKALEIKNLTKTYPNGLTALHGVDFSIEQ